MWFTLLPVSAQEKQMMSMPLKAVCPKCKVNLRIYEEMIVSEAVKFKCSVCGAFLRIKEIIQHKDISAQSMSRTSRVVKMDNVEIAQKKTEPDTVINQEKQDRLQEAEVKSSVKSSSKRKFKRVKFNKKVLIDNKIMAKSLDLSENGIYVHTGRSFKKGSIVEVAIPTAYGNFDLKIQAKVIHNHRAIGMGLMFVNVDDIQRAKLQKLLNSLGAEALQELECRTKILLVGGSNSARNIYKSKLVLDGFCVMQATTITDVNKTMVLERPDAIIMDWQEKAFDCQRLLYKIKKNHLDDDICIVVLSTFTDSAAQKEIIDAGADSYLAKVGTSPVKLSLTLQMLIKKRKGYKYNEAI